eukprot:5829581-Amphidinium_carterae.1
MHQHAANLFSKVRHEGFGQSTWLHVGGIKASIAANRNFIEVEQVLKDARQADVRMVVLFQAAITGYNRQDRWQAALAVWEVAAAQGVEVDTILAS